MKNSLLEPETTTTSMKSFYQKFGLHDYPFNVYTAENESQYAASIFVHPQNYDAIKESFEEKRSIIIRGNRGTGKTALLNDLQKNTSKSSMMCIIDDYSELSLSPTTSEYYKLIISNLVIALFSSLFTETKRLQHLSREDKLFLSMLLEQYTTPVTQGELIRKIESIQLSRTQRFFKNKIDLIRAICNYGLTAGLNVVNDVIRNYYSCLPPIDQTQI